MHRLTNMSNHFTDYNLGSANNSNNDTMYMQLEQAATTNDTTSEDGDHVISMHYAVNNNTLTTYGRSDLDILLQLVVIIDYNTHWFTCMGSKLR